MIGWLLRLNITTLIADLVVYTVVDNHVVGIVELGYVNITNLNIVASFVELVIVNTVVRNHFVGIVELVIVNINVVSIIVDFAILRRLRIE